MKGNRTRSQSIERGGEGYIEQTQADRHTPSLIMSNGVVELLLKILVSRCQVLLFNPEHANVKERHNVIKSAPSS